MKGLIASSMNQVDSTLRVLFATEAYGMGADAPDVRQVIHIGVPSSLDSKYNNILKHTAHISTSWPYHNQCLVSLISDFMMSKYWYLHNEGQDVLSNTLLLTVTWCGRYWIDIESYEKDKL